MNDSIVIIELGNWINHNNLKITWELVFDSLSISLLIPVIIVSLCAQIYSYEYLNGDPHTNRFFFLLSLFSFSMILLCISNNLFILLISWEFIGLISYFLINYWFTSISNNFSALKTRILNNVGDWFIILAIILAYNIHWFFLF